MTRTTRHRCAALAAGLALMLGSGAALASADGIDLGVTKSPAPDEVRLEWAGGQPNFEVFRADTPADVNDPGNSLGETSGTIWFDTPPPGTSFFYRVASTCGSQLETCNDIDDDCDGTVDNGPFEDNREPNDSCAAVSYLGQVGSDQSVIFSNMNLYPSGDADHYRIRAVETDSSCACCDIFCTDEDYRLDVRLTAPAGAGSYQLCASTVCESFTSCVTVAEGETETIALWQDGSCAGGPDEFDVYVRVRPVRTPGFECAPYTLDFFLDAGVCM